MKLEIQEHISNVLVGHPGVTAHCLNKQVDGGQPKGWHPHCLIEFVCGGIVNNANVIFPLGHREEFDV